jgi:hypothetical protein
LGEPLTTNGTQCPPKWYAAHTAASAFRDLTPLTVKWLKSSESTTCLKSRHVKLRFNIEGQSKIGQSGGIQTTSSSTGGGGLVAILTKRLPFRQLLQKNLRN